jgi:hypothetical protein
MRRQTPHEDITLGSIFNLFKGRSSAKTAGKSCKTYRTRNGVTINQCKDGGKTFVHKSSTKKATKTTSYVYKGKKR